MTPEELLKWEVKQWKHCGCGRPSAILELVYDQLKWMGSGKTPYDHVLYEKDGPTSLLYEAFLNQLDIAGLTDHGSSIFCSFLSKQGESVLKGMELHGCDRDHWLSLVPSGFDPYA